MMLKFVKQYLTYLKYNMEQDPLFMQMMQKSFLLKKIPNLQIPMRKKQKKIKHQFATLFALTTLPYLIFYPLDTIKTRMIAIHKTLDIARFQANKAGKQTAYLGILLGYGPLFIGNLCQLTIAREKGSLYLLLATVVEGVLKNWIDMSKVSKQMANQKGDLQIMKKSFLSCTLFGICRDLAYRFSSIYLLTKLQYSSTKTSFVDQKKSVNNIFLAIIISTLVSHPFEVCYIKTASQRSLHYRNPIQTIRQIWKQEGLQKIFLSGLWPRLTFNMVTTLVLAHYYSNFLNAALQAF